MRRKLALRLFAVSAPLAVVAAAAVFLTERARIGDDVLSFTVTQAALFNAEHGRVLDQLQTVESAELDAALRDFANPVSVARGVMEKTPHVMLAGVGAEAFAREHGFV